MFTKQVFRVEPIWCILSAHRNRGPGPSGRAALASSPASFDQAFRSLRRGGRLVCGVIASIVGTRNDLADVFTLYAAGRRRVVIVDRRLEVNRSISEVSSGAVDARVVFLL